MAAVTLTEIGEVVGWMRGIEERVGYLYARAAELCPDDAPFQRFLLALAQDEQCHAGWMSDITASLKEAKSPTGLDMVLDEALSRHVEAILDRFERFLGRPEVSAKGILEYVARAEASELNPMFLYIIDRFRGTGREGQRISSEIQKHLMRVQKFIDELPREARPAMNVCVLPRPGEIRLLVVDNDMPLQKLLGAVLACRGTVDTAPNGEAALACMREHFHEVIVANLHMPDMGGFDLYRRAVQYDSHLKANFVFYSTFVLSEERDRLARNKLLFLQKPFGLTDFYKAVDSVLWGDADETCPED